MKKIITRTLLLFLLLSGGVSAKAQFYSVSTNLLTAATGNLNAEVSMTLNRNYSLHLPFQYNPFVFGADRKQMRNFTFTPSLRYWFRDSYSGWFVAAEGVYSHYSVGGIWNKYRYAGNAYGGGFSLGRAYPLSKKWNWEWEIGGGLIYTDLGKFVCSHCGWKIKEMHKVYPVPTKAAIRVTYLF